MFVFLTRFELKNRFPDALFGSGNTSSFASQTRSNKARVFRNNLKNQIFLKAETRQVTLCVFTHVSQPFLRGIRFQWGLLHPVTRFFSPPSPPPQARTLSSSLDLPPARYLPNVHCSDNRLKDSVYLVR